MIFIQKGDYSASLKIFARIINGLTQIVIRKSMLLLELIKSKKSLEDQDIV